MQTFELIEKHTFLSVMESKDATKAIRRSLSLDLSELSPSSCGRSIGSSLSSFFASRAQTMDLSTPPTGSDRSDSEKRRASIAHVPIHEDCDNPPEAQNLQMVPMEFESVFSDETQARSSIPVPECDIPMEECTTIMIRNIPCRYNQNDLLREVQDFGLDMNFLYLPQSRTGKGCRSYGFVNFSTPQIAERFRKTFDGYKFRNQVRSRKQALVTFARLQGFEANVAYFHNAAMASPSARPWVRFDQPVAFAIEEAD